MSQYHCVKDLDRTKGKFAFPARKSDFFEELKENCCPDEYSYAEPDDPDSSEKQTPQKDQGAEKEDDYGHSPTKDSHNNQKSDVAYQEGNYISRSLFLFPATNYKSVHGL